MPVQHPVIKVGWNSLDWSAMFWHCIALSGFIWSAAVVGLLTSDRGLFWYLVYYAVVNFQFWSHFSTQSAAKLLLNSPHYYLGEWRLKEGENEKERQRAGEEESEESFPFVTPTLSTASLVSIWMRLYNIAFAVAGIYHQYI